MSSFTFAPFAFATTSPAGPVFADAGHRAPLSEAIVGLGLGLPSKVLHTSISPSKSALVGLGIYIADFENGCALVSPLTSEDTSYESPSSGPMMMGTRRERRRMTLVDSPSFEYGQMHTPPPMAPTHATPSVLFAFVPPSVPDLLLIGEKEEEEEIPMFSCEAEHPTILPSTESISSGLNLLCLSDEELMDYVAPYDNEPAYPAALGLSLADLDGPELMFTLREHGFRHEEHSFSSSSISPRSSPSPLPHPTQRYLAQRHMTSPSPSRVKLGGVELSLDAKDEERDPKKSVVSTVVEAPSLGFESPDFWIRYMNSLYA
ncbi:hypothetical protein BC835DRAFT_1303058 [Cytidiella melzeri]|nr:hypothetical protein BC835DRAFT_1303058 [Cytidiella melzeri]